MGYNKAQLVQIAVNAARSQGIDPNIFKRQISQESGWQTNVTSHAGAQGIAQFMPATARGMGVNPLDPRSALYGAARMDARNLRKYGNWNDVLSIYNSGRGWSQGKNIGETNHYVRSILGGASGATARVRQTAPTAFSGGNSGMDHGGNQRAALSAFLSQNLSSFAATGHVSDTALPALLTSLQTQSDSGASPGPSGVSGKLQGLSTGGFKGTRFSEMLDAIAQAKRMGLRVSENPAAGDHVDPVHVSGSYHYQRYAGHPNIGRATDVSGSPAQEAAYYRWAQRRYGKNITELFYDPLGGIKNGKQIGAIGHHRDHVHIAF